MAAAMDVEHTTDRMPVTMRLVMVTAVEVVTEAAGAAALSAPSREATSPALTVKTVVGKGLAGVGHRNSPGVPVIEQVKASVNPLLTQMLGMKLHGFRGVQKDPAGAKLGFVQVQIPRPVPAWTVHA